MFFQQFLDIETEYRGYKKARFVVVPVPHEATTSYGTGAKRGPDAILRASRHIENFDEELGCEIYRQAPIHTLQPVAVKRLESRIAALLRDEKIPVILGGEHSLTTLGLKPIKKFYNNISVLQLDAHADLRDSYQGRKDSHACVMRRVLEICPAVQVGQRSISGEEWKFAKKTGQFRKIHWAGKLRALPEIVRQLSSNVYISIDVDVFDPGIVPAVGTPEPGGLSWYEVLEILKKVCSAKNVVGFDVVELSPRRDDLVSDFTVAKLVYKLMGYVS
ncbi:agmatinase [candidate division WOR-1 bacterium RIFCSPLOWO2_02_FULL_46_20]|uniref:Agmatinase n=2 Tax=Saganbacteria TaxID=1703751 RepID=A0A1F4REP4_UNCSA|nr:MAG: agmatinase [candidate division WOR-1 bacterium RIFCSPLOWO2_02_FULL_46_20]OGC09599.1 MAG: agmatinase [candidate division WOR-1 bacterium RIFCSPLOWO2_12_FULL_45_9]